MKTVSEAFQNQDKAMRYLMKVQTQYPRYMRDQLKIISDSIKNVPPNLSTQALNECLKSRFYSGSEFKDVLSHLMRQQQSTKHTKMNIKQIGSGQSDYSSMKPEVRDLDPYLEVLEGTVRS
ncbi:hypothetical protein SAMN05421734_101440 [Pelagirhabdus alkalitolerans]|uniref:Uncharacterized protein n=1 Tax=Pelagirhabdus alkalitolerans TaxID=1612202 RepID=A0A1G6GS05_9BACI|nr:hypothetical protein [Pelagirhabdus alkalitolerans]SDB84643.1 hypothetical protein SAMN05421734_101440 [Pelagirhabdus alkalitolerans]